jgi:hypothetical protein
MSAMAAAFCAWGGQGTRKYEGRAGVLIVVDVLSSAATKSPALSQPTNSA